MHEVLTEEQAYWRERAKRKTMEEVSIGTVTLMLVR